MTLITARPTMDDVELTDGPPEGLFFAGSDEEEEDAMMDTAPETPAPSSSASSPPTALFIPGSDDEDLADPAEIVTPLKQKRRLALQAEDDSDNGIELLTLNAKERAHSVQSVDKMSIVSESSPTKGSASPPPPPKKRRISPPSAPQPTCQPTYLGDILVPNAWSNVSGKGYVKPNESIKIKRDEQTESRPGPSKSATSQGKKGDNKKQMSLTAMLKSKPTKFSKKTKTDNIVRLFNSRGFGNIFLHISIHWH
jgi:DNA repair protein RAD5